MRAGAKGEIALDKDLNSSELPLDALESVSGGGHFTGEMLDFVFGNMCRLKGKGMTKEEVIQYFKDNTLIYNTTEHPMRREIVAFVESMWDYT